MSQAEWLAAIDSAETNQQWESLKALAERRLKVAPEDPTAILALKNANINLHPELLFDEPADILVIEPEPDEAEIRATNRIKGLRILAALGVTYLVLYIALLFFSSRLIGLFFGGG